MLPTRKQPQSSCQPQPMAMLIFSEKCVPKFYRQFLTVNKTHFVYRKLFPLAERAGEMLAKRDKNLQLARKSVGMQNTAARMKENEFVHRRPIVLAVIERREKIVCINHYQKL